MKTRFHHHLSPIFPPFFPCSPWFPPTFSPPFPRPLRPGHRPVGLGSAQVDGQRGGRLQATDQLLGVSMVFSMGFDGFHGDFMVILTGVWLGFHGDSMEFLYVFMVDGDFMVVSMTFGV